MENNTNFNFNNPTHLETENNELNNISYYDMLNVMETEKLFLEQKLKDIYGENFKDVFTYKKILTIINSMSDLLLKYSKLKNYIKTTKTKNEFENYSKTNIEIFNSIKLAIKFASEALTQKENQLKKMTLTNNLNDINNSLKNFEKQLENVEKEKNLDDLKNINFNNSDVNNYLNNYNYNNLLKEIAKKQEDLFNKKFNNNFSDSNYENLSTIINNLTNCLKTYEKLNKKQIENTNAIKIYLLCSDILNIIETIDEDENEKTIKNKLKPIELELKEFEKYLNEINKEQGNLPLKSFNNNFNAPSKNKYSSEIDTSKIDYLTKAIFNELNSFNYRHNETEKGEIKKLISTIKPLLNRHNDLKQNIQEFLETNTKYSLKNYENLENVKNHLKNLCEDILEIIKMAKSENSYIYAITLSNGVNMFYAKNCIENYEKFLNDVEIYKKDTQTTEQLNCEFNNDLNNNKNNSLADYDIENYDFNYEDEENKEFSEWFNENINPLKKSKEENYEENNKEENAIFSSNSKTILLEEEEKEKEELVFPKHNQINLKNFNNKPQLTLKEREEILNRFYLNKDNILNKKIKRSKNVNSRIPLFNKSKFGKYFRPFEKLKSNLLKALEMLKKNSKVKEINKKAIKALKANILIEIENLLADARNFYNDLSEKEKVNENGQLIHLNSAEKEEFKRLIELRKKIYREYINKNGIHNNKNFKSSKFFNNKFKYIELTKLKILNNKTNPTKKEIELKEKFKSLIKDAEKFYENLRKDKIKVQKNGEIIHSNLTSSEEKTYEDLILRKSSLLNENSAEDLLEKKLPTFWKSSFRHRFSNIMKLSYKLDKKLKLLFSSKNIAEQEVKIGAFQRLQNERTTLLNKIKEFYEKLRKINKVDKEGNILINKLSVDEKLELEKIFKIKNKIINEYNEHKIIKPTVVEFVKSEFKAEFENLLNPIDKLDELRSYNIYLKKQKEKLMQDAEKFYNKLRKDEKINRLGKLENLNGFEKQEYERLMQRKESLKNAVNSLTNKSEEPQKNQNLNNFLKELHILKQDAKKFYYKLEQEKRVNLKSNPQNLNDVKKQEYERLMQRKESLKTSMDEIKPSIINVNNSPSFYNSKFYSEFRFLFKEIKLKLQNKLKNNNNNKSIKKIYETEINEINELSKDCQAFYNSLRYNIKETKINKKGELINLNDEELKKYNNLKEREEKIHNKHIKTRRNLNKSNLTFNNSPILNFNEEENYEYNEYEENDEEIKVLENMNNCPPYRKSYYEPFVKYLENERYSLKLKRERVKDVMKKDSSNGYYYELLKKISEIHQEIKTIYNKCVKKFEVNSLGEIFNNDDALKQIRRKNSLIQLYLEEAKAFLEKFEQKKREENISLANKNLEIILKDLNPVNDVSKNKNSNTNVSNSLNANLNIDFSNINLEQKIFDENGDFLRCMDFEKTPIFKQIYEKFKKLKYKNNYTYSMSEEQKQLLNKIKNSLEEAKKKYYLLNEHGKINKDGEITHQEANQKMKNFANEVNNLLKDFFSKDLNETLSSNAAKNTLKIEKQNISVNISPKTSYDAKSEKEKPTPSFSSSPYYGFFTSIYNRITRTCNINHLSKEQKMNLENILNTKRTEALDLYMFLKVTKQLNEKGHILNNDYEDKMQQIKKDTLKSINETLESFNVHALEYKPKDK